MVGFLAFPGVMFFLELLYLGNVMAIIWIGSLLFH